MAGGGRPDLFDVLCWLVEGLAGADGPKFWAADGGLILLSLSCFHWGFRRFRWARLLEDTPTAKVESCPQGYVEVGGLGEARAGARSVCPLTGTACLWYRYKVESCGQDDYGSSRRDRWRTVESGQSREAFWLRDETGRCLVVPAGAEITPTARKVWYGSASRPDREPVLGPRTYKYTEEVLLPSGALHVLGWFETIRPGLGDATAEVNDALRRLKEDHAGLLARFDRNKDGDISVEEWDEAREAIRREVLNARAAAKPEEPVHTMTVPSDPALPFVVSGRPRAAVAGRYRRLAALGLAGFFLAGAAAARLTELRLARRAALSVPYKTGTVRP